MIATRGIAVYIAIVRGKRHVNARRTRFPSSRRVTRKVTNRSRRVGTSPAVTNWGFTGSSDYDLTDPQRERLEFRLATTPLEPGTFHHGSAVRCDDQAGWIAHLLGYWIVVHPPLIPYKRAYSYCDELREEKGYIPRNHDIVRESERMLATPHWNTEPPKGTRGDGTLATINFARKVRRQGIIILPTGREIDILTGRTLTE
jgi:hypothetical protein